MLLPCLPPSTAVTGTGPPREARSQLWAQEWPGVELTGSVPLSPTVFCQQVIASSPLFVAGMLILWVLAGFCGQKLSKRLMCVCHCLCGHKWEPSEPHLVTRLPFSKPLIFVYSLSLSFIFFSPSFSLPNMKKHCRSGKVQLRWLSSCVYHSPLCSYE